MVRKVVNAVREEMTEKYLSSVGTQSQSLPLTPTRITDHFEKDRK